MLRCKRCHRPIRTGEYGPVCAKKRSNDEQLALPMDKPGILAPVKTLLKQIGAACRAIFKS